MAASVLARARVWGTRASPKVLREPPCRACRAKVLVAMNAFPSPANHTGPGDPAPDPSMEEILASIRRIIADDQGSPPPARTVRPSAPGPGAPSYSPAPQQSRQATPEPFTIDAEVLTLAQAPQPHAPQVHAQPAPRQYAAPQAPTQPPQYAPQHVPQPAPEPQPAYAAPVPQPAPVAFSAPVVANNSPAEPALLSAQADASVANAFEALTRSMMLQNSPFMEETVRDLLRPMLKQWLDDNLPPLVERLVRSEIERVARGGR